VRADVGRDSGELLLRLTPRPLAVLRGSVEDELGHPIAGATVNLERVLYPFHRAEPAYPVTDAKGRYRLTVWPGEEYVVYATAAGHGAGHSDPVRPRPGSNPGVMPIILRRADSFLDVLVVDEKGRPVPFASVAVQLPEGKPLTFQHYQRTDRRGRVHVPGVLPGRYLLDVTAEYVRRDGGEASAFAMRKAVTAGQPAVRIVVREIRPSTPRGKARRGCPNAPRKPLKDPQPPPSG
jgi:hypothetical protein